MDLKLEETNALLAKLVKRTSLAHRFLAGLIYSLGATLGFAIFLSIIGFSLSRIEVIPIIGGFISDIINNAASNIELPQNIK